MPRFDPPKTIAELVTATVEQESETKKPVLLSTGMSDWNEIDKAVGLVKGAGSDLTVMQCSSQYPCEVQNDRCDEGLACADIQGDGEPNCIETCDPQNQDSLSTCQCAWFLPFCD